MGAMWWEEKLPGSEPAITQKLPSQASLPLESKIMVKCYHMIHNLYHQTLNACLIIGSVLVSNLRIVSLLERKVLDS